MISNTKLSVVASTIWVNLIKEEWDYNWFYRDQRWDYEVVVHDRPLPQDVGTLDLDGVKPGAVAVKLDWGRYRLEVYDPATQAASSLRFYAGWSAKPAAHQGAFRGLGAGHHRHRSHP